MLKLGWFLRIPSLIYFEWQYESVINNVTKPETYFLLMLQSLFIVPETGRDIFPAVEFVLQHLLSLLAHSAFLSVAMFNMKVVKKLYTFLFCILLFVLGCNQYKLILTKLNPNILSSSNPYNYSSNKWTIYSIDFIQFIPVSQFRSASLIFILPIIYCPWLIFVQYFDLMSTQLLALCYGVANLPGLCLALNLPSEAQVFTYNFAVTSFLIAIIYKTVTVCVELPKTISDLIADIFVLINFNHHEAGLIEVPSLLWSLFSLSRQFVVFWIGLFTTQMIIHYNKLNYSLPLLALASIGESVQSPVGFIGFSVVSCYLSRLVLRIVDWFVMSDQFNELYHTHGIAEGFSTLIMMISLNRSLLRVNNNPKIQTKLVETFRQNGNSPNGLIALVMLIILSSIIESASELISSKLVHLASGTSTRKWRKHITPLASAFVMFVLPILICTLLYKYFIMDLWLMTIMGSFLMTSIHLIKSFATYIIYLNNARIVDTGKGMFTMNWDSDELILGMNAIVQGLEICIAIALIILLIMRISSGHYNLVSVLLLFVHFYFNVFERIKTGWNQYKHRKMVMKKIEKLYTVNEEELKLVSDICAICYSDLINTQANGPAKKTDCNHYFHRRCLKKWLLIRHSCPMCARDFNETKSQDQNKVLDHSDALVESDTESLSDIAIRGRSTSFSSSCCSNCMNVQEEEIIEVSSTPEVSSVKCDEEVDLKAYLEIDSDGQWIGPLDPDAPPNDSSSSVPSELEEDVIDNVSQTDDDDDNNNNDDEEQNDNLCNKPYQTQSTDYITSDNVDNAQPIQEPHGSPSDHEIATNNISLSQNLSTHKHLDHMDKYL